MGKQELNILWNTIAIELTYNDNWSNVIQEIYGYRLALLKIKSQNKQPLPITQSGYRSHFTPAKDIEEYGGVEKFVHDWLDQEAKAKKWQGYIKQSRQLTLF